MVKPNKKGRDKKPSIGGAFVPILHDELDSKAYRELTTAERDAYMWFKRICSKVSRSIPNTATIFDFSYSEAENLGIARATFKRCKKSLHEKGFIEVVSVGGLRGFGQTTSKYRLSDRWRVYGGLQACRKPF